MKHLIEPFTTRIIANEEHEGDTILYYDADYELIAQILLEEDQWETIVYYPDRDDTRLTKEQLLPVLGKVKRVFQQPDLVVEHIADQGEHFFCQLAMVEPVHQIPVFNTGLAVIINYAGQLEEIAVQQREVEFVYPDKLVSKDEARAILHQQKLVKLTISAAHDWQYGYGPDFDIFGIEPNGTVRFMHNMPEMKDASFKPLPDVEPIEDVDTFLLGGRAGTIHFRDGDLGKQWDIDSDDCTPAREDGFVRACRLLKTLVPMQYANYHLESVPHLYEALGMELDEDTITYRFVYVVDEISFDFYAASITVHTQTNQFTFATLPFIPYDKLAKLEKPTLTLEQANDKARVLADVTLQLERDVFKRNHYHFYYAIDYPTSPTQGNLQFIDGFSGEVHFVETGW